MILTIGDIILEFLALGFFVLYIFFSFCDGFGLKPGRKILWGICFLGIAYLSFLQDGHFDVKIILFMSSVIAFILAMFQRNENLKKKGKPS